jgi:hypothetical protein
MPEPARRTLPTSLRDTVRGWLEPAGWTFEEQEHPAVGIGLADGEFRWVDAVVREKVTLLLAEPTTGPERLLVCNHFSLDLAERDRLDRLGRAERAQLAWDVLSHLNLLQVEYLIDATVPNDLLLYVDAPRPCLTRDALLGHLQRLAAALRLVSLAYARALGTLDDQPAAPSVH